MDRRRKHLSSEERGGGDWIRTPGKSTTACQFLQHLTIETISGEASLYAPQPYYAFRAVAPRLNPVFLIGPVIQRGAVHVYHQPPY